MSTFSQLEWVCDPLYPHPITNTSFQVLSVSFGRLPVSYDAHITYMLRSTQLGQRPADPILCGDQENYETIQHTRPQQEDL